MRTESPLLLGYLDGCECVLHFMCELRKPVLGADSYPENTRRLRCREKSSAPKGNAKRRNRDRVQDDFNLLRDHIWLLADKLQRDMQRLRCYPSRVGR